MPVDKVAPEAQPALMRLGKALRQARLEGGVTQRALADLADLQQPTISRWEKGERLPSLEELWRVEDALGLTRGTVLIRAGLVGVDSVEHAIAGEQGLTDEGKAFLLNAYRAALKQFANPTRAARR